MWSGNLWFLWKVSSVRWCFAGANIWKGVFLKHTQVKGWFAKPSMWKDMGRGILLFHNYTHVLVHLTFCSWAPFAVTSQRKTHQKTSCSVLVASSDSGRLAERCQLMQTHVLRQDPERHVVFGGYINRTQQTVIEAGLHSWLCIIFANLASLREAQKRTSGVPVGPGCSCWLVPIWQPSCFC
jgi:hypothetical protein